MSKDLPLPKGWVYAGSLLDGTAEYVPTTAEGRHEALLHSAPSIHIELTPELDCCALCCIHDEPHEMYPGLEHGDC